MTSHAMDLDAERPIDPLVDTITIRLQAKHKRKLECLARESNKKTGEYARGIIREYIDHHEVTRGKA